VLSTINIHNSPNFIHSLYHDLASSRENSLKIFLFLTLPSKKGIAAEYLAEPGVIQYY